MKYETAIRLAAATGLCGALTACPAPPPGGNIDLVPVTSDNMTSPTNATAFCDTDDNANLKIYIRNIGRDPAPATMALVTFFLGGSTVTELRSIEALSGGQRSMPQTVPIPPGCFNPDCDFSIMADSDKSVEETDETNNSVTDVCIG